MDGNPKMIKEVKDGMTSKCDYCKLITKVYITDLGAFVCNLCDVIEEEGTFLADYGG